MVIRGMVYYCYTNINRIQTLKRDNWKFPNREDDVNVGLLYQQHDTGQMTSRMQKWGLRSTKKDLLGKLKTQQAK